MKISTFITAAKKIMPEADGVRCATSAAFIIHATKKYPDILALSTANSVPVGVVAILRFSNAFYKYFCSVLHFNFE
jgi:ABC-type molybdate transport system substrate-binding protein